MNGYGSLCWVGLRTGALLLGYAVCLVIGMLVTVVCVTCAGGAFLVCGLISVVSVGWAFIVDLLYGYAYGGCGGYWFGLFWL